MKRLVMCVFLVGIAVNAFSSSASAKQFCIQSFNAYGPAYATRVKKRTRNFVSLLKDRGDCEVLHLQEVWRDFHQDLFEQQVNEKLGHHQIVFHDRQRNDNFRTGLGIITQGQIQSESTKIYEINENGFIDWVRKKLGVKKAYSMSEINFPNHPFLTSITFTNTHLHHASQAMRLAQLLQLSQDLLKDRHFSFPVVITGDFNFEPKSLEWLLMTKVMAFDDTSDRTVGCTYCAANPLSWSRTDRKIDFIFSRSSLSQDVNSNDSWVTFKTYNGQPLSDHYGVQSGFEANIQDLWDSSELNFSNFFASGRFTQQIAILNEVRAALELHGNSKLEPYIEYTNQLISRLGRESSQDPWVQLLETR